MSKMFEIIMYFYKSGSWSKDKVHDAVTKGKITPEEYELITGEKYE